MWRRFVPSKRVGASGLGYQALKTIRTLEQAAALVRQLRETPEPQALDEKLTYYRLLLIAQTPQAVKAQWQMDIHKHGYHNRHKRLFELIDFNDTFVSLVLLTPIHQRMGLPESLRLEMEQFCRGIQSPMFSGEQFEAIVRGLGREIAVYTAAEQLGYTVRMTSRTQDAFGIDMMIIQPGTEKRMYIDCKTPSAYRHRLEELVKHGYISDAQLLRADEDDFVTHDQYHNGDTVPVTLLCIRPDTVGYIHTFAFDEPARFKILLERMFASVTDRKVLDIFAKKW